MRATVMPKAHEVRIENVPDGAVQQPTDAVIRITRACICGSDLWPGNGTGLDGAQAEALRIPNADGTLYPLSVGEDDALMPSLLTLSDVMGTGHHAAVVGPGPARAAPSPWLATARWASAA